MRPLKLIMQAFGPYAERVELDMEQLGETGLYAITGETGSGKTTIFDAIVYALYGSGSGTEREAALLRSSAAGDETETLVTLTFDSRGKVYTVTRKPKQSIKGKRGIVEKPASAELILPDRNSVCKGVNEIIQNEIIGLDKAQFCQTVMIAQGEFRKLLQAGSDERTKILRKVFRTERFVHLVERLKERMNESENAWENCRRDILADVKSLRLSGDSAYAAEVQRLIDQDYKGFEITDALSLTEAIVSADEAEESAAAGLRAEAEAALQTADLRLKAGEEIARKQARFAQLSKQNSEKQADLEAAVIASAKAQSRQQEIDVLNGRIAVEKSQLPEYARLTGMDDQISACELELSEKRAADAEMTDELKRKADQKSDLSDEASHLEDASERRRICEAGMDKLRQTEKALNILEARLKAYEQAKTDVASSLHAVETAEKAQKDAESNLTQLEAELSKLGNTEAQISRIENLYKEYREQSREYERVQSDLQAYTEANERLRQCQTVYLNKEALSKIAREKYQRISDQYNLNLAGILASRLVQDKPCPVCGSLHHPSPAKLTDDAVYKTDVDEAENAANSAKDAAAAARSECVSIKTQADQYHQLLSEKLAGIPEDAWPTHVSEKIQTAKAEMARLAAEGVEVRKADKRREALEDDSIPKAKQLLKNRTDSLSEAQRRNVSRTADLQTAERELREASRDLMPDGWTPLDLSDKKAENARTIAAHQQALAAALRDEQRLSVIISECDKLSSEIEGKKNTLNTLKSEIAVLESKLASGRANRSAFAASLPYKSEAEAKAAVERNTAVIKELTDAIEDTVKVVHTLEREIAGMEGELRPLAEALEGVPEIDMESLQDASRKAKEFYLAADEARNDVTARLKGNAASRGRIKKNAENAERLEQTYLLRKRAYDVANGTVSGQAKVSLEAFAQMAYFDRIIDFANTRLIHMSDNQFALLRRKTEDASKKGQTGLDLDIIDYCTGTRRPIGTLSGGEGFLASLSFALGASDAMQSGTAVHLDSMFVDEGFGSLSERFLRLAMNELENTASEGNRLIGIISHVDEVKGEISRGIEVVKKDGVASARIKM